jgi:hypothetical protein
MNLKELAELAEQMRGQGADLSLLMELAQILKEHDGRLAKLEASKKK